MILNTMEAALVVLLAAVTGGLVAGIVTAWLLRGWYRRSKLLDERRNRWRSEVKRAATRIVSGTCQDPAQLRMWATDLRLNLDPDDGEDKKILFYLDRILYDPTDEEAKQQLCDRITYLLKYEWEDAKRETRVWPFRRKVHRKKTN